MSNQIQRITTNLLDHLYKGYLKNPTALVDIGAILINHGESPNEFGKFLFEKGWIKSPTYFPNNCACQITLEGIDQIRPQYYNDHKDSIIFALGQSGTSMSAMGILSFEKKDNQKMRDIVNRLRVEGYINDLEFTLDDANIDLSLKGREYYENNKANFL